MGLVKRITRSRVVQETLGFLVAVYLKFVQRTNRFVMEPADAYDRIEMPVIAANTALAATVATPRPP